VSARPAKQRPVRLSPEPDTADEVKALREATREAHAVLRDLRHERRAIERSLVEVHERVRQAVGDQIEREVAAQVARLGKVTEKAMRDSVAKVGREFDRLERILTGCEDDDRPPLEDQLREIAGTWIGQAARARRRK